jgi:hypothetical protein
MVGIGVNCNHRFLSFDVTNTARCGAREISWASEHRTVPERT